MLDYQHDDGGWGWWKTDENHPFMTAYALYGLLETRAGGYHVNDRKTRQGLGAMVALYASYPRAVPALKAYMLFVLTRAVSAGIEPEIRDGSRLRSAAAIDDVWQRRDRLTPYGRALLLHGARRLKDARGDELATALARRGEADRRPRVVAESTTTRCSRTGTTPASTRRRWPCRRLRRVSRRSPVLESAVRYLLAHRQSGAYWATTKQTAMALYGLTAFMRARGEPPSAFSVDVVVNGKTLPPVSFDGGLAHRARSGRLSVAGREGDNVVTLTRRGDGALYWSAAATYFDTRTPIERTGGRRLAIAREYFVLTPRRVQNRIVYRETPFEGTAVPGDVLLVRLTVAGAEDWRYLLIEDPLPAGAETIADDSLYPLEKRRDRPWGARQEFRDDRAVFFQDGLPGGRVEFWYLLKIVTPGDVPRDAGAGDADVRPGRVRLDDAIATVASPAPDGGAAMTAGWRPIAALAAGRSRPRGSRSSGGCCRCRRARSGCSPSRPCLRLCSRAWPPSSGRRARRRGR